MVDEQLKRRSVCHYQYTPMMCNCKVVVGHSLSSHRAVTFDQHLRELI